MNFNVDKDLFLKGPSTSDMELIAVPYESQEASSKTWKSDHGLLRSRRRNTQPASSLFEYKRHFREARLREAASLNNTEAIERIIINTNVNPNAADAQGRTPLHIAASRGFAGAVASLIRCRADVNAEDKLGNTPMHLAVYTGSVPTVCALIRGGAHLRRTATLQYTPLQLVESKVMLFTKHTSVFCHMKDTLEIIKILRFFGENKDASLEDLDELANKVSEMSVEGPEEESNPKP